MIDRESNPPSRDIAFDRWIKHVFDHPEADSEWYFNPDVEPVNEAETALGYLTTLFKNAEFLLHTYSPTQIDTGLYYLVSPACSDAMQPLVDESIPWPQRRECIHAMLNLYTNLWAPLYNGISTTFGDEQDPALPNNACYMWWDVIILWGGAEVSNIDEVTDAVFYVFENGLKLQNEVCLESILHGCGHWYHTAPDRVDSLVADVLKRTDISASLRQYAEAARHGAVQ